MRALLYNNAADVAFEMSMNDNLLSGTIPAELQYLPIRVCVMITTAQA